MTQEINRAFHEALGKCWHTFSSEGSSYQGERICTKCGFKAMDRERNPHGLPELPDVITVFPDYCADPRLVIKEIDDKGREHLWEFIRFVLTKSDYPGLPTSFKDCEYIVRLIMNTTGRLALLALEWLKEKEK